jgi:hypothetical protein
MGHILRNFNAARILKTNNFNVSFAVMFRKENPQYHYRLKPTLYSQIVGNIKMTTMTPFQFQTLLKTKITRNKKDESKNKPHYSLTPLNPHL